MDTTRVWGSGGLVLAWLEIQGLSEESLRAAVTGLGIEILEALCARAEPPTVRVRLCSLSARKFTYTMYAELCRYMESCRAGRGSEWVVVPGFAKDADETGGSAGVVQVKFEDEHPGLEEDERDLKNGKQEKLISNIPCTSCYRTFNKKVAWMRPRKRHRTVSSDKTNKCSDNYYSSRTCYKRILMKRTQTRTKERPYTCSVCGKGLSYSWNLKNRTRTHTGERPYPCKFCGKRYSTSSTLKSHTRIHTGERPYTCTVCEKTFTLSSTLKAHSRIHTGERPYTCTFCGKAFSFSSALKTHKLIHTGESPYTCTVCGKVFSFSSALKRHEGFHLRKDQRMHLRENPYKCSVCSKVFARAANLTKHKKNTHRREALQVFCVH